MIFLNNKNSCVEEIKPINFTRTHFFQVFKCYSGRFDFIFLVHLLNSGPAHKRDHSCLNASAQLLVHCAVFFLKLYILSKWRKKLSMAIHGKSGCKSHNHFYWARLRSGGVWVGVWLEVQILFNRLNFRLIQDVSQPIPGRWKVIIKIATKWALLPCVVWLGYWWVHFGLTYTIQSRQTTSYISY